MSISWDTIPLLSGDFVNKNTTFYEEFWYLLQKPTKCVSLCVSFRRSCLQPCLLTGRSLTIRQCFYYCMRTRHTKTHMHKNTPAFKQMRTRHICIHALKYMHTHAHTHMNTIIHSRDHARARKHVCACVRACTYYRAWAWPSRRLPSWNLRLQTKRQPKAHVHKHARTKDKQTHTSTHTQVHAHATVKARAGEECASQVALMYSRLNADSLLEIPFTHSSNRLLLCMSLSEPISTAQLVVQHALTILLYSSCDDSHSVSKARRWNVASCLYELPHTAYCIECV